VQTLRVIADSGKQVRFAETGAAVDEERVVRITGSLSDAASRGRGQAVGGADYERIEGESKIQFQH
jgi:hypothetical protein